MTLQRAKILSGLQRLYSPDTQVIDAEVTSVDDTAMTCEVKIANGQSIKDVHLKALKEDSDAVVILPKVGTDVQMIRLKAGWMVISCDVVDKVIVKAAVKVQVDCDDVVFNGGENEGLVIVAKCVEKLNAIEQDINALKQVFSGWSPVSNDGGGALKGVVMTWAGQQLQQTQQSDLENTKVKH